jgi:hypothetical protein
VDGSGKLDYNPHRNAKGHTRLHLLSVLLHDSVVNFGVCVSQCFATTNRAGQRGFFIEALQTVKTVRFDKT